MINYGFFGFFRFDYSTIRDKKIGMKAKRTRYIASLLVAQGFGGFWRVGTPFFAGC